jgi:acyl-CoA synthetase (AMP-forming)/AMP-acid ligase II
MGLIGAWLGSLYFGLPLVSMSPLAFLARPLRWLLAISHHRGTLSAAPNFAYELCLTRIADGSLEGLDLSPWRWAFNGAEPVSPPTLRRFAERFARCGLRREALAPVYGLAEAAVGLAFPPPGRGPRIDCIDRARFARGGHALPGPGGDPGAMEVVACGRPLPGYRVRSWTPRPGATERRGLLQFQALRPPKATTAPGGDGTADSRRLARHRGPRLPRRRRHPLTGSRTVIRGGRNIYPYGWSRR